MSGLPLDDGPDISAAAHDAARGQVVYLTEYGERLAAVVPAEFVALLEDLADGAARQALAEPGEDIPRRAGLDRAWPDVTGPAARYGLVFPPAALRALRKLDRQAAERIKAATEALRPWYAA